MDARLEDMRGGSLRWFNMLCSILAIIFLGLRNHFRKSWNNEYYNK